MEILKSIRNNLAFIGAKALDNKIDGRDIGARLDEQMDKELGNKSEKIQRGPFTNLLLEIIEGLWEEDLMGLIERTRVWLNDLAYRHKKESE